MSDWCEHDDYPETCPPCRRKAGLDPSLARRRVIEDEVRNWHPIEAKYPGHCMSCNTAIHEGQMIVQLADRTGYIHTKCTPWSGPSDALISGLEDAGYSVTVLDLAELRERVRGGADVDEVAERYGITVDQLRAVVES